MFRRSGKKPSKKVVINVLRMDDNDNIDLDLLLRTYSELNVFKKDVGFLCAHRVLELSHTILLRKKNGKIFIEVVGQEIGREVLYRTYIIIGGLISLQGNWFYNSVHVPHLCLAFIEMQDPLHLANLDGGRFLAAILLKASVAEPPIIYFPEGWSSHGIDEPDGTRLILHTGFSRPVIIRPRQHEDDQLRFEILGDEVAVGMSGQLRKVRKIAATCVPLSNGTLNIEFKERMVKEVIHSEESKEITIAQEYRLTSMAKHTHVKRPLSFRLYGNPLMEHGFMVGKLFPGMNLEQYMTREPANPFSSITQLFRISLALLRRYEQQVMHVELVHRDIKPRNVTINQADNMFPDINWIDFGLSKAAWVIDPGVSCGTLSYVSPEVYSSESATNMADVYSLGLVLAELWGLRYPDHLELENANQMHERNSVQKQMEKFFLGNHRLTLEECEQLVDVLYRMCAINPMGRLSLLSAINKIDDIRFTYMQRRFKGAHSFVEAHDLARKLSGAMLLSMVVNPGQFDLHHIKKLFLEACHKLHDHPDCVDEFVQTLGMPVFSGCNTVALLVTCMNGIVENYFAARYELEYLRNVLCGQDLVKIEPSHARYLAYLARRAKRYIDATPESVEDAVEITKKLNKNIKLLVAERDALKVLVPGTAVRPLIGRVLPLPLCNFFPVMPPPEPVKKTFRLQFGRKKH